MFKSNRLLPCFSLALILAGMSLLMSSAHAHDATSNHDGAKMQADNLFPKVKLETNFGDVIVELDRTKAPITVNNFLRYIAKNSYNNTIFHRIVPGFVVQGGGYTPELQELPSFGPIINESGNGLKNTTYSISMARREDPHTANRQFFFNVNDNTNLDPGKNWGYTVFGEAIEGTEVLDAMAEVETQYELTTGWANYPKEQVLLKKVTLIPEGQ